jgi:hypothetical protein
MEPTYIKSTSELFVSAYVLYEGHLAKVLGIIPDREGGHFVQTDVYVHSVGAPTEYVVTVDQLRGLPLDDEIVGCLFLTADTKKNLKEKYLGISLHFAQYSHLVFGGGELKIDLPRLKYHLQQQKG